MRCMRCLCLIVDHLLCISVVCTDKEHAVYFLDCFYSSSYTLVNCLNSLYSSRDHTCMSYHIRVCKIDDNDIILTGTDGCIQLLRYFRCTHLRLQIISCNSWRLYKYSVLILVWLFHTTVEEECNMSIFLCLSGTKLLQTICSKILAKCILDLLLLESDDLVRDRLIVILEAYICQWQLSTLTLKSCKLICTECSCDLTRTVWTEVKEDNRIVCLYSCNRLSICLDNSRKNKLICLIICIRICNCLYWICSLYALAIYHSCISFLYTIPVVITIHCIVTTGNTCDLTDSDLLHLVNECCNIILTRCWRCISTI